MGTSKLHDAELVLSELRRLRNELSAIGKAADRRRWLTPQHIALFQQRLRTVKKELKALAKWETVDGKQRQLTELERCFFGPAVRSASAHFHLRVDAGPDKWVSGLYDSESDLSYHLLSLQKFLAARV